MEIRFADDDEANLVTYTAYVKPEDSQAVLDEHFGSAEVRSGADLDALTVQIGYHHADEIEDFLNYDPRIDHWHPGNPKNMPALAAPVLRTRQALTGVVGQMIGAIERTLYEMSGGGETIHVWQRQRGDQMQVYVVNDEGLTMTITGGGSIWNAEDVPDQADATALRTLGFSEADDKLAETARALFRAMHWKRGGQRQEWGVTRDKAALRHREY